MPRWHPDPPTHPASHVTIASSGLDRRSPALLLSLPQNIAPLLPHPLLGLCQLPEHQPQRISSFERQQDTATESSGFAVGWPGSKPQLCSLEGVMKPLLGSVPSSVKWVWQQCLPQKLLENLTGFQFFVNGSCSSIPVW